MERLKLSECKNFIEYASSVVTQKGLLLILNEYSEQQNKSANSAIRSWYQNMVDGKSYQDAIEGMSPRFPSSIEQVLIKSIENSYLDHALTDLKNIFTLKETDDGLIEDLGLLVDKYVKVMNNESICEGCLIREMVKIMQRACLEDAFEIVFKQDSEKYFIQKFLGPKTVSYIEPCHSKLYKTLFHKVEELAANQSVIKLLNIDYKTKKIRDKEFIFYTNDKTTKLTFLT